MARPPEYVGVISSPHLIAAENAGACAEPNPADKSSSSFSSSGGKADGEAVGRGGAGAQQQVGEWEKEKEKERRISGGGGIKSVATNSYEIYVTQTTRAVDLNDPRNYTTLLIMILAPIALAFLVISVPLGGISPTYEEKNSIFETTFISPDGKKHAVYYRSGQIDPWAYTAFQIVYKYAHATFDYDCLFACIRDLYCCFFIPSHVI